jgi:LDH2 family malate/lactate/ureidoglycolate dehydrogenase
MVECLAGALAATAESLDSRRNRIQDGGAAGRQGAFFWLVRPAAFSHEGLFGRYMAQWIQTYVAAGGENARVPGARGNELERKARAGGIELDPAIERELDALGARLGIPFPA